MKQNYYSCTQANIELDINKLKLDNYDNLVVVENRDSFNDWYKFKPYVCLINTLVVYRGDKYHSTACKALLKIWLEKYKHKPAIYFGDYDLAGLRLAISGGYSHLLLPEYDWLEDKIITQHYPVEQEKYLSKLELDCPAGWKKLLNLMKQKRAGLRQQKMYNTKLTCIIN